MKEAPIEERLRVGIEDMHGLCYKLTVPGRRNMPDRLITLPFLDPHMVETKRPGKDATDAQKREHIRLKMRRMPVYVLNTIELVDEHLAMLEKAYQKWRASRSRYEK